MDLPINIRLEQPEDYDRIDQIIFRSMKRQNEVNFVREVRFHKEIYIPELTYVAEVGDEVLGYLMLNRIQIKNQHDEFFETLIIEPLAICQKDQKKGIGHVLLTQGIKKATEMGFRSILVLGPDSYFENYGFIPSVRHLIKPPFIVMPQDFMVKELFPGALKEISGEVVFPKIFADTLV